jgi:hypothetical protein
MAALKFIQFFKRKYPFLSTSTGSIFIISFCVGFFIFVLRPFGFVNYEGNKIIACLGFSLVTLISLFIVNFIKKRFIKNTIVKWTIFKEFIFLNLVLLLITLGNYFYLSLIMGDFQLSLFYFIYTLFLTFSVGIFPVGFVTLFRYNRFKNNKLGVLINDGNDGNDGNEIIEFISLNKTDKEVIINKVDFLYVEAIKNNVHIYYYDNELVKTISIRNTLKNIENQCQDKTFFRCHRSFIVNTNNIKTAKGNSNSYKIYFNNYNHFIPVSRSYTKAFQSLIY